MAGVRQVVAEANVGELLGYVGAIREQLNGSIERIVGLPGLVLFDVGQPEAVIGFAKFRIFLYGLLVVQGSIRVLTSVVELVSPRQVRLLGRDACGSRAEGNNNSTNTRSLFHVDLPIYP